VPSQHQGQIQNVHLEGLIFQYEDTRNMSGLETISAGWIICNSWAGIAATFALAIVQGGPVTLVYGPILMCVLVGACAVTLAELASVYPTAGGQYHWVSILAPKRWSRMLVSCPSLVKEKCLHATELLLWSDKCVLLDRHLCRHCYHRATAVSGHGSVLESGLCCAAMACVFGLPGGQRLGAGV
jgi:amino acid transporter